MRYEGGIQPLTRSLDPVVRIEPLLSCSTTTRSIRSPGGLGDSFFGCKVLRAVFFVDALGILALSVGYFCAVGQSVKRCCV